MPRFSGGLHLVGSRTIVEAELDSTTVARRLRTYIHDLYSLDSDLLVIDAAGLRRIIRYAVRVTRDDEAPVCLTGLADQRRRPIRGLPAVVVDGPIADSVVAWWEAFLARGFLMGPGWSTALEVICPGSKAVLVFSDTAQRLGITVKSRESRGVDCVVLRGGEAIADLLARMGARETRLIWEGRRMRREVKVQTNRLTNFDNANLRRSARAVVTASAQVERALEISGEDAPVHLVATGRLRIEHCQASLKKLGKLCDPPLTKDAAAGRIRWLLVTADKAMEVVGIPNVEASLSVDLNDSQ